MNHATHPNVAHPNATLTPAGRLKLARLVVVNGWTLARAAERFSVSPPACPEVGRAWRWPSDHGGRT